MESSNRLTSASSDPVKEPPVLMRYSALTPKLAPGDDSRFIVSNTALEIVNGYTRAHELRAAGVQQTDCHRPSKDLDPRASTGRHLLYRYEMNGIVVYDSHARGCDESRKSVKVLQPANVSPLVRREIDGAQEYDREMFLNMPQFPRVKTLPEDYTLVTPLSDCLRFDSKFESGNLHKAIKVTDDEYTLLLDYDIGTKGHTQWFYFAVRNERAGQRVRLSIVNLMKYDSLYNNGMKPLVRSRKKEKRQGVGWHRTSESVSYYQNNIPRTLLANSKLPQFYYTLSFVYTFEYDRDVVYFAHCYPYTFTDLQSYLNKCALQPTSSEILRIDTLCSTNAGNDCPVLTITQGVQTYTPWEEEHALMLKTAAGRRMARQREERKEANLRVIEQARGVKLVADNQHRKKKGVVLSARVHPGETNSSYMMQGAINFLLSDAREARILRKHFIFKVIPMLNPDGVVYGNYRCSLLGVDLNRRWQSPNKILHPTVFFAKKLMQMFAEQREVVMFCDMHGHSMKKNVFMYACGVRSAEPEAQRTNILSKLVPMLLSQTNKVFSLKDSRFRLEKSKESTARIVAYKELGIVNSYTLEASFYGPSHIAALHNRDPEEGEANGDSHLQPEHLEGLGRDLCKVALYFISPQLLRKKLEEVGKSVRDERTSQAPSFLNRPKKDASQPAPPPHSLTDLGSPLSPPRIPAACPTLIIDDSMLDELQSYDGDGDQAYMSEILQAIEAHPELAELANADAESDSGGSDSLGSDNDDQKADILAKIRNSQEQEECKRSKTAPRKKPKAILRSDSATRSRNSPVKAQRLLKPVTTAPAKSDGKRDVELLHTIQQHLDTLYKRREYSVKMKDTSSPHLKKGRSSQSFSEEDGSYSPIKGREFRDTSLQDVLDSEPKVKLAKAAGGYQNFSVPPRPELSFSPSSSFIITSIHNPKDSCILNPKLNYLRKPSFRMYRKTQRPARVPPIPRSAEMPRGRPSRDSSRIDTSPLSTTAARDSEMVVFPSEFSSKR